MKAEGRHPERFDGVSEAVLASADATERFSAVLRASGLLAAQGGFVDEDQSVSLVTVSEVVLAKPLPDGMVPIRSFVALWRNPSMTFEEFDSYWREVHAPLVLSVPEVTGRLLRYVQRHSVVPRQQCDGVAGAWFADFGGHALVVSRPTPPRGSGTG
jgi:hypothetical protein